MKSRFIHNRFLQAFVICLLIGGFYFVFRKPSKNIRPLSERIATFDESDPRWEVETLGEKKDRIDQILNQPFHFLGQGRQSSAYESLDGKYALKFLWQGPLGGKKREYVDFSTLVERFTESDESYSKRKSSLYSSFLVAYQYAPEQTGTVFVHLNATKDLYPKVVVLDNRENPDLINSDTTQWVIQKRARLIKPVIIELMWEGKIEEAKKRIDQLFALLFECAMLGVIDGDTDLIYNNNIGFLEERAIYVDIGQLRRAKQEEINTLFFENDLSRLDLLYHWLESRYPELAEHYRDRKVEVIELFGLTKDVTKVST